MVDVGCGGGQVSLILAKRVGPKGHVTGLDFDEEKIALARAEAAAQFHITAQVAPGDLIVALTDGVLESRAAGGEQFGEQGVLAVLRRLKPWTPETAVAEIDAAVRAHVAGERQDDVTVVAAQWSETLS